MVLALEDRTVPSTFWVTNRNDAGAGSLRQAVLDANSQAGADVIKFRHSAEGTITLTTGELSIAGDLRIDGRGTNRTTVSGGGASRVFSIASGVVVQIDDLTIANGHVQNANGAGVLNAGFLTLDDVVVTGCSAARVISGGLGGGIENTGTLTVNRSWITGNAATGNHASVSGGGLHNATGATAAINRSTVSGNTCVGDGAGIRNENGATLTVEDCQICGNVASGSGTGGIASGGPLTVRDSKITDNTSAAGGVYLFGGGDTSVSRSLIAHNSGVGFWSDSDGHIRIEDCMIRDNSGGGLYGFGDETDVIGSLICNNGDGNFVGGIAFYSPLNLIDSVVRDNVGFVAGGIYFYDVGVGLHVVRSVVGGNLATLQGFGAGGIHANAVDIVDSTVSGNTGDVAGGVYAWTSLRITRSTICGNQANPTGWNAAGGVVGIDDMVIENSTISGNTVMADNMTENPYSDYAGASGGVLALHLFTVSSNLVIDHSTVAFNRVDNAPLELDQVSGGVVGINSSLGDADVSVRNTIVAINAATGRDPDVNGSFQSQGHNLIGVLTANATGFVASDLTGTEAVPLDPRLKPLGHNGGRTKTHALRPDSPALNAGDNADAPPTDQRGRTRIVGGTIDIGSYEASFGGGVGLTAVVSVNSPANWDDNFGGSALVGRSPNRLPETRDLTDSDEQFGSKLEIPIWLGMDEVNQHAMAPVWVVDLRGCFDEFTGP